MKKHVCSVLVIIFALIVSVGCGTDGVRNSAPGETDVSSDDSANDSFSLTSDSQTDADMFTDRDRRTDYSGSDSVYIELNGDSAVSSSDSV